MRKIAGFLMAVLVLAACKTSDKKGDSTNTTIQWLDSTFIAADTVKEGEEVEVVFRFKNTGDNPLVFSKVQARCGCTVADKPEEPIAPGAEGSIKGKFDSKGRKGINRKQIEVQANTIPSPTQTLEFEVFVE